MSNTEQFQEQINQATSVLAKALNEPDVDRSFELRQIAKGHLDVAREIREANHYGLRLS